MKRLLFIFCFLLILPFAQAQNNDKYPEDKTTQALDNKAFEKTTEAYRVTNVTSAKDTADFFAEKTSGVSADSVNFGFLCKKVQIYNDNVNDTLYVSRYSNFYNAKKIYPTDPYIIIEKSLQYLYIKSGSTATSGKKYRVYAW